MQLYHRVYNFIKKRPQHWCLPADFAKFWEQLFLQNTFGGFFCRYGWYLSDFQPTSACCRRIKPIFMADSQLERLERPSKYSKTFMTPQARMNINLYFYTSELANAWNVNSISGWAFSGLLTDGDAQISHISYNNESCHSYTLPKEDPKNIWLTLYIPWVLLTSAFFFHRKSATFVISRNTDIDCILMHNF